MSEVHHAVGNRMLVMLASSWVSVAAETGTRRAGQLETDLCATECDANQEIF